MLKRLLILIMLVINFIRGSMDRLFRRPSGGWANSEVCGGLSLQLPWLAGQHNEDWAQEVVSWRHHVDPSPGVGGVGILCRWAFAAGRWWTQRLGVVWFGRGLDASQWVLAGGPSAVVGSTFVGGPSILVLVPSEAGRHVC